MVEDSEFVRRSSAFHNVFVFTARKDVSGSFGASGPSPNRAQSGTVGSSNQNRNLYWIIVPSG